MEKFMNSLTDMDLGWWPFLFLRPNKTEFMTSKIVAKMSLYYGLTYGMLIYMITIPEGEKFNITNMLTFLLLVLISFFIIYRFSFAYFWNLRVEKLNK